MKKTTILVLAIAFITLTSCRDSSKEEDKEVEARIEKIETVEKELEQTNEELDIKSMEVENALKELDN